VSAKTEGCWYLGSRRRVLCAVVSVGLQGRRNWRPSFSSKHGAPTSAQPGEEQAWVGHAEKRIDRAGVLNRLVARTISPKVVMVAQRQLTGAPGRPGDG
jgi:hypothetical protein